jgi:hypothetical protein
MESERDIILKLQESKKAPMPSNRRPPDFSNKKARPGHKGEPEGPDGDDHVSRKSKKARPGHMGEPMHEDFSQNKLKSIEDSLRSAIKTLTSQSEEFETYGRSVGMTPKAIDKVNDEIRGLAQVLMNALSDTKTHSLVRVYAEVEKSKLVKD